MVLVKVRETYDLHTVRNKMTLIAIHTPKPDIIKRNYPGLLMQCRAWRPHSCDVRVACASVLPLDPRGVGTTENDVAPEDVFNPILYKAMSNKGMSQLESRINCLMDNSQGVDTQGSSAFADVDTNTNLADEFNVYYGLLSDTHGWKHASPQQGLSMSKLRPLVYEMVYNVGDMETSFRSSDDDVSGHYENFKAPNVDGLGVKVPIRAILGKSKEHPFLPCTQYDANPTQVGQDPGTVAGFGTFVNAERTVPYLPIVCGAIIIPPSRLHELYYRMVVEWTLEFTAIRSLVEITDFPTGIGAFGSLQHYQNYGYSATKEAVTGDKTSMLDNDSCMVSANVEVDKVM